MKKSSSLTSRVLRRSLWLTPCLGLLSVGSCASEPEGLAEAAPANVTVKMDFFHKPLPEIALPNDIATRYDAESPTKRRVNASMIAVTEFESRLRERLDTMDGWGVLMPIVVPFSAPIDIQSVIDRHDDVDYATEDDAIYVINITPSSPRYGEIQHLDIGNGNYPSVLERQGLYWKNDPRGDSLTLFFEEADEDRNRNGRLDPGEDVNGNGVLDPGEDVNGNGVLDPPEDTDADGLLDVPNYRPGHDPAWGDLKGRADAIMTFYERQTNTLVARPLVPLDDHTTYAVVVTRRILDLDGKPVGSPYRTINHIGQTEALQPLLDVLPKGLSLSDIAFTYSFTTQTIRAEWQAVRDGLYGHGVQKHIGEQFPAEVSKLHAMRDTGDHFPGMKRPHLLHGETWRPALELVQQQFTGGTPGVEYDTLNEGTRAIDYFTVGTFSSPQLFPREDAQGNPLPLDSQVWPADLSRKPAPTYPEDVHFTLSIPRKEVSPRGEGKPAPVIILGHGYTGNRFDVLQVSSYFARLGFAVIGIDGPSHGLALKPVELTLARGMLGGLGLSSMADALFSDRAVDQNADGIKDSGADFWTSYMFHTRDMVRQFALDYMQLVRVIRSFDGQRRWAHDTNGDGQPDLAGDFDGDGQVDVSKDSPFYFFGGSLGGIMAMIAAGVEPAITAIAPVAGGGGYADLGPRSTQGGVPEAFILRAMGPLFTGTLDADSGELLVETIVADLNDDITFPIATVSGLKPWDTMVTENLRNGVRRCGFISEAGTVRTSLEADLNDPVEIRFYRGPQVLPSKDCQLREGAVLIATVDQFQESFSFQGTPFTAGQPLVSLMEGLGLRRSHPDFRRMGGLAQMLLDPSDPAVLAQYWQKNPITYPGTGETTGAHALIITTMGDTSVPVSGGILVGRASGIVPYLENDPRYGVPANEKYISTYTTEGVHNLMRYVNPETGGGVHLDIENFSGGNDVWGSGIPRIDVPMRIGFEGEDLLGGKSAHIVPYTRPEGQHGFDMPGSDTDRAIRNCLAACTEEGEDPCNCSATEVYDVGFFMLNMVGRYFQTGGQVLSADLCQSRNDCSFIPALPTPRDPSTLD
ncbi:MAG: hypothetical protein KIT72_16810 [Polyangiaceae bacterium]|nr:hypothetical protein [Polyangiaceae bacterium]MCW5792080.1 hypothetical protein [Polyangiaceae bacterium]